MQPFFHLLNPNRHHRTAVREFFESSPAPHVWIERGSHPTHLETVVEWAMLEGYPKIAVWGGDGSLNRVVQKLHELKKLQDVSVLLFPTGTCNDFARKLRLPEWKTLWDLVEQDDLVSVKFDLGFIEYNQLARVFMNNAGFGRGEAAKGRSSNALKDILSFFPKSLALQWTNEEGDHFERRNALLGIIFNAPYFSGGLRFASDIEPDDGRLNAFFVEPQNRLRLLWRFLRARFGTPLSDNKTARVDGSALNLQADSDLYLQADGEWAEGNPCREIRFSVLPKTVNFFVPAGVV